MRHLLFPFFTILFCFSFVACHDNDDNPKVYPNGFTPFTKSDTCFTATVEKENFSQVGLVFDVDEKICDEKLLIYIDSQHEIIKTYRWVYNKEILPRDLKSGDRIKFKILAYKQGEINNGNYPVTCEHVTFNFFIQLCE